MTRRRDARRAVSPPPLGSMSQQAAARVPGTATCSACGSSDLVRIRMGAPTGLPLVFVSCRACEQTAWFAQDGDGTPLSADGSPLRPAPGPVEFAEDDDPAGPDEDAEPAEDDEDDEAAEPAEPDGPGDDADAEPDEPGDDAEPDEPGEATPDAPPAGNAR